MLFETACVVGVGLIGGSFGIAVRERKLVGKVVGAVRREETINKAFQRGAVDNATTDLQVAARGADLVFLAPPVGQIMPLCKKLAPMVRAGAVITDAGSTKAGFVDDCTGLFGSKAHFVGGHPMAGSERTGVEHARGNLFEKAVWAITPTARTSSDAVHKMKELVEGLGATPLLLEPDTHDRLLAVTSHLPHITAAALVHLLMTSAGETDLAQKLIATGWRDATRVAAGSPEMWRDICLANSGAISTSLDVLIAQLQRLRQMLQEEDAEALQGWFEAASATRRKQGYFPRSQ